MSLPKMPLHIGDYLKETTHFGAAEHGAYLLLIMHYWAKGSLPDDDVQLARITRMSLGQWRKARPTIQSFFHDGWKHQRIDEEIVAATERYEKFAKAGRESGKVRAANNEHRSNEAMNDVGNEWPQSFKQPITGSQEEGEGDSAGAGAGALDPVPSPEAIKLAAAYREAIGILPDDPQWAGLPYTAQVWLTRGYECAAVLAFGSALAARYGPKPMKYHATAIENEMDVVRKTGAGNAQNRHDSGTRFRANGTGGFARAAVKHARAASES
jgi:uncharacterized protein YdaU (DUF1376 family)